MERDRDRGGTGKERGGEGKERGRGRERNAEERGMEGKGSRNTPPSIPAYDPADQSCQIASKLFHSFSKYRVHW